MNVKGEFDLLSGSFTHNNGKVVLKEGVGLSTLKTFTIKANGNSTRMYFYDLELNPVGAHTTYDISNATVNVAHDLDLVGSNQIFINTSTSSVMEAEGDVTVSNTSTTGGGTATLVITGTNNQTFADDNGSNETGKLCNVKINKSGGTVTLDGNIAMGGSTQWEYTAGTVDEGDANILCYYANRLKNSSSGAMKFYDVDFYGTSGTHTITNTVTILHKLHTSQTGGCTITGDTPLAQVLVQHSG